jgi:hypothetical protein
MYSKQCPASAESGVGVELMLVSTVVLVVLNCPCV